MHSLFTLISYLINPSKQIYKVISSSFLNSQISSSAAEITCTGPAATSKPASPPPITRPSGPANEMLIPPDLLFVNPFSVGIYEPVKERISKRPQMHQICSSKLLSIYPVLNQVQHKERNSSNTLLDNLFQTLTWIKSHARLTKPLGSTKVESIWDFYSV